MENIHPIFDKILDRPAKEQLLKQRAVVVWLVGLSGSGKSTIAQALEKRLHQQGYLTMLLDGDNVRSGLNKNLGFSAEDRLENQRRVAEVAKLFLNCGIITLCSFISPTKAVRSMVREVIGKEDLLEVFVKCSFETCARRDVKGLYKKALNGEIKNFTGLDAPFEEPQNAQLILDTEQDSLEESAEKLYNFLIPHIRPKA